MYNTTPIHILLADDDEDDRMFFQKALQELNINHRFSEVINGERLMTYLQKNTDNLPDILFLDLNMPRKNGTECLTELKANPLLKDIAVVICSTSMHEDSVDLLYKLGAHYYMHKSDYGEMAGMIDRVLALLAASSQRPPCEDFIVNRQKAYK